MNIKAIANLFLVSLLSLCMIGCGGLLPQKNAPNRGASYYPGTLTSNLPNYAFSMSFTASAQTVTQNLGGLGNAYVEFTSATCSAITFQVKGSIDGGLNYFPLAVAPYVAGTLVPSTSAITLSAATAEQYVTSLQGMTNVEIVTSSTFTCTGVVFYITGSSNPGLVMNIG